MNTHFHLHAETVPIAPGRPLLIVDADEVVLAFARGFDKFLGERGLYLDLVSYRLHGNVRRRDDRTAILDIEVTALLEEFRTELDWLEPIDGAIDSIAEFRPAMDVVVVSNVTPAQAPARLRNLAALGLAVPLVANSGPKGPCVKLLAERARAQSFFVDDIPMHHASVAEMAPDVARIHFVGDERLKALMPSSPHAHIRANSWREIADFVRTRLNSR